MSISEKSNKLLFTTKPQQSMHTHVSNNSNSSQIMDPVFLMDPAREVPASTQSRRLGIQNGEAWMWT